MQKAGYRRNPCPVCMRDRGVFTTNHKASFCRYKESGLVCNFCAGAHKVTECPILKKRECERCRRTNHKTADCTARACSICGSAVYHAWSQCIENDKLEKSRKVEEIDTLVKVEEKTVNSLKRKYTEELQSLEELDDAVDYGDEDDDESENQMDDIFKTIING